MAYHMCTPDLKVTGQIKASHIWPKNICCYWEYGSRWDKDFSPWKKSS